MKMIHVLSGLAITFSCAFASAQEGQVIEGQLVRKEAKLQHVKAAPVVEETSTESTEPTKTTSTVEKAPAQSEEPKKAQPKQQTAVPK